MKIREKRYLFEAFVNVIMVYSLGFATGAVFMFIVCAMTFLFV